MVPFEKQNMEYVLGAGVGWVFKCTKKDLESRPPDIYSTKYIKFLKQRRKRCDRKENNERKITENLMHS